jgi:Cu2+-exporting ATPase
MLAPAGRLALASRHPLAVAVARAAGAKAPLAGAVEEAGQGVRAMLNGVELRLGSATFCGARPEADAVAAADPEASVIAFACGERRFAFAVRQRLRADAGATIARLKAMGLAVEILSGDCGPAVARAAHALDVAAFRAAVLPADKIAHIKALKRAGRKVLMIGDGINDAPSLAAADVSLSPASAAHLAQAAADAVFLGEQLAPVADAIAVARKARRVMQQNLWLAAIYNFVAVPAAIAGLVTPLFAALAMSGSSVLVTVNALRAKRGQAQGRA